MSIRFLAPLLALSLLFCLFQALASGAESGATSQESRVDVEGLTLVYRFESGRTYRARYTSDTVHFELLAPRQGRMPSGTLAYTSRKLRDDLFLVVWTDPAFHTTFVVDLAERQIHASTLRAAEGSFFATAEIVEVSWGAGEGRRAE